MLIRFFAVFLLFLAAIIAAGVSGLTFRLWPTAIQDRPVALTPAMLQQLRDLQAEHKFTLDTRSFYPGAVNETQRATAQAAVDAAIGRLLSELPQRPQRSTVLAILKQTLAGFALSESEERDQLLIYFGRILETCQIEHASELFNVWRYGFPYGWLA
ncbi:DUF4844 domain-containing protein [Duganella qianjiadongensis]|uniref:DUF4844 domain-containing protein n=1 Tax=Duganella qianjiadongensis TaxID=2692176 RepID=A0ABW9VJE3_9BURK|nr:DUF4844 domain-containing protein [Duganella qianjiadongensis]MYM39590.1 DUF4844 domain-containing protein [Duganella qianjiadongensis]